MTKKVCLIDGSGYIFRAFYALPILTSPKGVPVNAVLGFLNMFMRLRTNIQCDYCLVLFDAKRKNFRNEIFAEYKGTRKDTPEELIPQFPIIRQAVDVLNLNYVEMEGFEADDLIATYAKMSVDKGYEVVVVSADKDLMQLIRPHVSYYDSMKDKFFTPEDVKEKFGVLPDKVVDVQALAGDSIDNVPGVPGIGLKTAAELVNTFGSLEEVLAKASEIKQNKRRETLLASIENAKISKELVTLKADVPVEKEIEAFACRAPKKDIVLNFVDEYGLNSLRARAEKWVFEQAALCGENVQDSKPFKIEQKYACVATPQELEKLKEKIESASQFAFALEEEANEVRKISVCTKPGEAYEIALKQKEPLEADLFSASICENKAALDEQTLSRYLKPLFEDKTILKIGQDMKHAIHLLKKVFGKEADVFPADDVSVISYDLDSSEHLHDLSTLSGLFLPEEFEVLQNKDVTENMPLKADALWRLHALLKPRLLTEKKVAVYENIDRPLIKILQKMEENGVMLDAKALMEADADFTAEMNRLEQEIFELAGEKFNLASPKQIGDILFVKMGLKGKKTTSGNFQTGADVLEDLALEHVLPAKILQWRMFYKLKTTYTNTLLAQADEHKRVHTTFSQTVVNTGRLASSNPNLQNIPIKTEEGKKIRKCFVAPPGYKIIAGDYSQVELRLLATVADVKALKEAFFKGVDIHALTASRVFGVPIEKVDSALRRHAKAINFGIVYGISQYGLAKQIDTTPEIAKAYIDSYFKAMPEIKEYMAKTIEFAHKHGFVLTPYGRKCSVLGINDKNKNKVSFAERAAINAPIQGGAADIIKLAMKKVDFELKARNMRSKMVLQVHDELVLEAPVEEAEAVQKMLKEAMESVTSFDVPFVAEVGVGDNWSEAH